MVENTGNAGIPDNAYQPSDKEKQLVAQHLGAAALYDAGYKASVTLSKAEAMVRHGLVSDIEYDFQLALNKGEQYLGKAVVNFYLNKEPQHGELFLNLQSVAIADLVINDKHISADNIFKDQRIRLDLPHVALGWNTVTLRYLNNYNTNRVGLHTYTDTSDQRQYLYSQFEAFHCFRVFPVFDQPNLKAKMSLAVTCPDDWSAVSNSIETRYASAK